MTEAAVYERIKSRLLAQPLAPGHLLQIGVLADELGVSTTPVREALTRLAAERLIVSMPKRGFFARTPSREEIVGLYSVNRVILDAAVARWPEEHPVPSMHAGEDGPEFARERSAGEVARATGDLFVQIALRSGIGEFAEIVRNVNDRLHHARVLECEVVPDAFAEITRIAGLTAAGNRLELRQALAAYHDGRLRVAAAVCKELLLRPFTAAER